MLLSSAQASHYIATKKRISQYFIQFSFGNKSNPTLIEDANILSLKLAKLWKKYSKRTNSDRNYCLQNSCILKPYNSLKEASKDSHDVAKQQNSLICSALQDLNKLQPRTSIVNFVELPPRKQYYQLHMTLGCEKSEINHRQSSDFDMTLHPSVQEQNYTALKLECSSEISSQTSYQDPDATAKQELIIDLLRFVKEMKTLQTNTLLMNC